MDNENVNDCSIQDVHPRALYQIIKLRLEVFGDEQGVPWSLDFDDRDLETTTRHIYVEEDAVVQSYLRLTQELDGSWKLGRVVTRKSARGKGLASLLNRYALDKLTGSKVVITAEAYLEEWYAKLGFVSTGKSLVLADIPHVEMVRE